MTRVGKSMGRRVRIGVDADSKGISAPAQAGAQGPAEVPLRPGLLLSQEHKLVLMESPQARSAFSSHGLQMALFRASGAHGA